MYSVTNLVALVTRAKRVGKIFRELARREHREHKRGGDFIREWVRAGAEYRGLVRRVEAWGFIEH
jgi:hypothetical protein